MKTEIISKLLDRYFEGETTTHEEDILKEYFLSGNVDSEFEQYRQMFGYFSSERSSLESLRPQVVKRSKPIIVFSNFRNAILSISSVAAAAVLLLMLIWPNERSYRLMIGGNKVNDQELAVQIASEQLAKLNSFVSVTDRNVGKLRKVAVVDNYFGPEEGKKSAINSIADLLDKFPGQ